MGKRVRLEDILNAEPIITNDSPKRAMRKGKSPAHKLPNDAPPIKIIRGQESYVFMQMFQNTAFTGLKWGALMDLAPKVRRDLAAGLVVEQEQAKTKTRVAANTNRFPSPESEVLAVDEVCRAGPPDKNHIVNFYMTGQIKDKDTEIL